MKIIYALMPLIIFSCNSTPSLIKENTFKILDTMKYNVKNKYCYFFEAQLHINYELSISSDTIFVYHYEVMEKTWFDNQYKEFNTKDYNIKEPFRELKLNPDDKQLFLRLKDGIPEVKYTPISNDLKRKISNLGLDINYKKIQKFNDLYFLLTKKDANPYPFIFVFNEKSEKIDTIIWNGHITEDKIEDFFLFDFKKDDANFTNSSYCL